MSELHDHTNNEELNQENEELMNIEENIAEQLPSNSNYYYDDSKSFKDQLTEFFTKYRPGKLKHVKALVKEYKGQEEQALDYLYYKYVTRVEAIVAKKRIPQYIPGQRLAVRIGGEPFIGRKLVDLEGQNSAEGISFTEGASSVKKKKGLLYGLVVLVILLALFFLFKDKIMGGSHEDHSSNEKVEEVLNSEEKISKESLEHATTVEDSVALIEKILEDGVADSVSVKQ